MHFLRVEQSAAVALFREQRARLHHVLNAYVEYYQRSRTRLSPDKDSPIPRAGAESNEGRRRRHFRLR